MLRKDDGRVLKWAITLWTAFCIAVGVVLGVLIDHVWRAL